MKEGKACSDAARLAEAGGVRSKGNVRSLLAKRMIDAVHPAPARAPPAPPTPHVRGQYIVQGGRNGREKSREPDLDEKVGFGSWVLGVCVCARGRADRLTCP